MTKQRDRNEESCAHQKIREGDLISFEGRYAMYTKGEERWVIQLTPTQGLVVNIDDNLITVFTGESHCVIDCVQSDVVWKIVSSV